MKNDSLNYVILLLKRNTNQGFHNSIMNSFYPFINFRKLSEERNNQKKKAPIFSLAIFYKRSFDNLIQLLEN
jgi:chloramphenicol O-acetyltransferase